MLRSRFLGLCPALLGAAACLLLLAACEDPSGVGLSIVDIDEDDPQAQVVHADTVRLTSFDDVTGATSSASNFGTARVLAGHVQDPAFGTFEVHGYIDFLPPSSVPPGFRDRELEEVRLLLDRSYVYGDTSLPTTLELYQVSDEWNAAGALADTSFAVEDGLILAFEVSAADSLLEIALPETWVSANDTTLRNASASTLFHGFQLRPAAGAAAVYGFSGRSALELISEEDTVRFAASELFSHIESELAAANPPGLVPLQDGTSAALELTFPLDTLGRPAINTAYLRVQADTSVVEANLPAGFVRPFGRELGLFVVDDDADGDPIFVTAARLDPETQTFSFSSTAMTGLFQDLVLGQSSFDRFLLSFPFVPASLDVVPVVTGDDGTGPRAVLVVVPALD